MREPKIKDSRWSKDFEHGIYESWKLRNTGNSNTGNKYKFDAKSDKPLYSIDTPPPYVNKPIHIGHATTYTLMDMFARYRRMMGYNVLFPLGFDRNGLPIEMEAEKRFKVKLNQVSREKFLDMCKAVLEESSSASTDSFVKLGIGFNSYIEGDEIGDMYCTDSASYRALTQATFIELYNKGLIYLDNRINNFCPGCQTTLADSEIEYADLQATFNDITFICKETSEELTIGTTRPELICSCGAVIFHPADERYKHLDGMTAITPHYKKQVPIMAHPMADMTKGTGLAMMCSAGDTADIRFFREQNLEPVISINQDGAMNENAGFLQGLKVSKARDAIIEELNKKGLLVKQTSVVHRTPVCERSKDPIEFIAMEEFYLKQVEFKEKMLELGGLMNFHAESSRQIFVDWVKSISIDWPITRRRYYATEVPLWYCTECGGHILPPKGRYYQPWRESPPAESCASCPKCNSSSFKGEERVFDTWFDSSISPLYILKWGSGSSGDSETQKSQMSLHKMSLHSFYEHNPKCSLRPQGKEIIRTWLYYTVLKCYLLTGRCVFKDVWINYHILDGKGKKMSKSLGNVIDPHEILDKCGAEPFRLWCAIEGNLDKADFKCSFERIDGASKTLMKLWNVARFVSQFDKPDSYMLTELDRWIINETNRLVDECRKKYEHYDFHNPVQEIKHFIWEIFASHYIELAKNRAYNENGSGAGSGAFTQAESNGAVFALYHVLETVLKLLAPVVPFITYKLYDGLFHQDVHFEVFPEKFNVAAVQFSTADIANVNSAVWKAKKDAGQSLKATVACLTVLTSLQGIKKELMSAHYASNIEIGNEINVRMD